MSLNELSHSLKSPTAATKKLLFRFLNAHLYLGLFDKVENLLNSQIVTTSLSGVENVLSITTLENDLNRLRDESRKGQYNLQGMLHEHTDNKIQMFADLSHHHATCSRNDLFEIRPCQVNNYSIYSLKSIFHSFIA